MAKIRPHGLFDVWSPDTVAECLDGIGDDIYRFLWNDLVPLYDGKKRSEWNDDFSRRCLAKYWSKVPEEFKTRLNDAATAHESKWKKD